MQKALEDEHVCQTEHKRRSIICFDGEDREQQQATGR